MPKSIVEYCTNNAEVYEYSIATRYKKDTGLCSYYDEDKHF